jgi:flagellar basal body P-ring formation protein FlgA
MRGLIALLAVSPLPAMADAVVMLRTVPAGQAITVADVTIVPDDIGTAVTTLDAAIGFSAVSTLYPGDVLRPADLAVPLAVRRNALITLAYRSGGLVIETQGRALDDGAAGTAIQVMNLSSRNIVSGIIRSPGLVEIGDPS